MLTRKSPPARSLMSALLTLALALWALPACAQTDDVVILTIPDTTVSPADSIYYLSFYLANPQSEIAGIQMQISASWGGLMELVTVPTEDTSITCHDSVCDTSIQTINSVNVDPVGSPLQYWDYLQAIATSPPILRVAGINDLHLKPNGPPPLPASDTAVYLFRIALRRIASPWLFDTSSVRSVTWFAEPLQTYFSDPYGRLVPMPDTILCFDPPACTNVDTVPVIAQGTITIGPGCIRGGDFNRDNTITSSDIIGFVNYVFKGGPPAGCSPEVGDVNCDGSVNSSDIIFLVGHVFKAGPPPCVP